MRTVDAVALALATLVLSCVPAQASESLTIHLDHFRDRTSGDTHRLRLKQAMGEIFGNVLDLDEFELDRVEVHAKSRGGNGALWLETGDTRTGAVRVPGGDRRFRQTNRGSYEVVALEPDRTLRANERWDVRYAGNLRFYKAVVHLNDCTLGECRAAVATPQPQPSPPPPAPVLPSVYWQAGSCLAPGHERSRSRCPGGRFLEWRCVGGSTQACLDLHGGHGGTCWSTGGCGRWSPGQRCGGAYGACR